MKWRWEKEDGRFTRVAPVIAAMLEGASEICSGFFDQSPQYLPFHDNEAAGVSLLGAGAARKGMFPVAEYPVEKKTWEAVWKKFGKPASALKPRNIMKGRADLSILSGGRYFSFEFKKTSERNSRKLGPRGLRSNLEYFHEHCIDEIDRVHDAEYHHIMAGIIAPVFENTHESVLKDFCKEVHMAASIGSSRTYKVYFFFSSMSKFG